MSLSRTPAVICASLLLSTAATAGAATIEGTVTFQRAAPPAVLVWMPGDHGWKTAAPVVIDQRDQAFSPLIAVAPPGATVEVRNGDVVQHNVFSLDPERDLGIGDPGSTLALTVTWPSGSVVRHGCKIHPQMQLWVASLDTAHHQVVPFPDGALSAGFRLADVPESATRLAFWSPRGEPLEVTPGGETPIMRKGMAIGTLRVLPAR